MSYYIYFHYTADTNELFYIGKGTGKRAYQKTRRNAWWKNKVAKHGFRAEIIQMNIIEQEALMLEQDMIALNRKMGKNLVNLTDGGEGVSGLKHSLKSRVKMSISATGNKNNLGRMQSIETRTKISITKKGKPLSPEHRAKVSKNHSTFWNGHKHTEESKAKMSIAQMGNKYSLGHKHTPETKAKISASLKLRRS
jgi:hypothetical protein